MGVMVKIDGRPEWGASRIAVTEDSTPLNPADTSGGVGQITATIPDSPENRRIRHKPIVVDHTARGVTRGEVVSYGGNVGVVNLTAYSRLVALNVERTMQPYTGTLGGLLTQYFAACGITTDFTIDSSIASIPVTMMGWQGNVWERTKRLCAAWQFEVSLVNGIIVARPPRTIIGRTYRNADEPWAVDDGELAQTIEVNYLPRKWQSNALAYPTGGWNEDVQVYSVDAGEVEEFELKLNASLASVQQPVCVDSVARGYIASSVYCVAGNDGIIIPPAQWKDEGGKVEVTIGEDTRTLKVKITGPALEEYAPYRLMMPSGTTEGYSSLRIVGTGVFFEEKTLVMIAHPDPVRAPQEVGITIAGEELETAAQAFRVGLSAAGSYCGPRKSIQVTTTGIGSIEDPTADLLYGNVPGARVFKDGNWYRIRSNAVEAQHRYGGEADNTIGDHNRAWRGRTIAEWNAFHAGMTIGDLKIAPLEAPEQPLSNVYPDVWYPDQVYPA